MDLISNFVLDRSGSMHTIWDDALGAVNGYVKDRLKEDGNTWLTLTTFDDKIEMPFIAWNVLDLPEIGNRHAYPRGSTALLDAIGRAVRETEDWLANNLWFNGKVSVAIMTDGMENSSREFTNDSLAKLIEQKQAEGWQFIYLGANQDSFANARLYGIDLNNPNNLVSNYVATGAGTRAGGQSLSSATTDYRNS